jgi:glutaminase
MRVRCEHSSIYGRAGSHLHNASRRRPVLFLFAAAVVFATSVPSPARGPIGGRDADYQMAISQAHKRYLPDQSGTIPEAVPRLAKVSPHLYGLVLVRVDGKVWEAGDSRTPFVLSGVAAPFTAALVAEQGGTLADKVLDAEGALVTLSLASPRHDADAKWRAVLGNLGAFAGRDLFLDDGMYRSASGAAAPVQEMALKLAGNGKLQDDAAATADLYVKQSAVTLTTYDLALMAATFANDGKNPMNGRVVVKPEISQSLQALMSRDGLQKAGMSSVAGRAGCILAVVPGRFGLAVYSPPLDAAGNSVRGKRALQYLSQVLMVNLAE